MSMIVYGPKACGKTRNAQRIAKHLGYTKIVDDWHPGLKLPSGTLALTNDDSVFAKYRGVIEFDAVMKKMAGK